MGLSERVYLLAGALLAECPELTASHALRLAVKIVGVVEEGEQYRELTEMWEMVHERRGRGLNE